MTLPIQNQNHPNKQTNKQTNRKKLVIIQFTSDTVAVDGLFFKNKLNKSRKLKKKINKQNKTVARKANREQINDFDRATFHWSLWNVADGGGSS